MVVYFHKNFTKQLKKLSLAERCLIKKRLEIFMREPFHPFLHNHPLKGKYLHYRSIDIRFDLRAIYKECGVKEVIFVAIGTHSQLYK